MPEPWFIDYEQATGRKRHLREIPDGEPEFIHTDYYVENPPATRPDAPWLPYVEPGPTLIGPFGGKHPPLPPNAPRWRRILRAVFQFCNEAGYTLIGGR